MSYFYTFLGLDDEAGKTKKMKPDMTSDQMIKQIFDNMLLIKYEIKDLSKKLENLENIVLQKYSEAEATTASHVDNDTLFSILPLKSIEQIHEFNSTIEKDINNFNKLVSKNFTSSKIFL